MNCGNFNDFTVTTTNLNFNVTVKLSKNLHFPRNFEMFLFSKLENYGENDENIQNPRKCSILVYNFISGRYIYHEIHGRIFERKISGT